MAESDRMHAEKSSAVQSDNTPVAFDAASLPPPSFEEVLRANASSIYGYLVRCGISAADRDDLFQDIFLKISSHLTEYDHSRPLKPWIFAIAANTVRSYFRSQNVREAFRSEDDPEASPDREPAAESVVEARETAHWLELELANLPLRQREVLLLACVEQLALTEVADALGIPINTVKTYLRRARIHLAKSLARRRRLSQREGSR